VSFKPTAAGRQKLVCTYTIGQTQTRALPILLAVESPKLRLCNARVAAGVMALGATQVHRLVLENSNEARLWDRRRPQCPQCRPS
jgi:hypothetical protein